ncbi:MAG: hypothetical protein KY437_10550 [Actinobacteria bacterium]|nr:hypothetical protein [Actinomycetota bacterium]
MRARTGAAILLATALALAGPGITALQAGEVPSERGRPSEPPGGRAPQTPPGQDRDEDGTGGGPGPAGEDPAPGNDRGPATSDNGPNARPPSAPVASEPPPPPDLTGTRVLRSALGTARRAAGGEGPVAIRDLRVQVTETDAAGIDGGWWVVVTSPDGEVEVAPPSLRTVGSAGVPRTPEHVSVGGGPLFWIAGQRSAERYQGLYEAAGTVELPADPAGDPAERPVVTVLLIQ